MAWASLKGRDLCSPVRIHLSIKLHERPGSYLSYAQMGWSLGTRLNFWCLSVLLEKEGGVRTRSQFRIALSPAEALWGSAAELRSPLWKKKKVLKRKSCSVPADPSRNISLQTDSWALNKFWLHLCTEMCSKASNQMWEKFPGSCKMCITATCRTEQRKKKGSSFAEFEASSSKDLTVKWFLGHISNWQKSIFLLLLLWSNQLILCTLKKIFTFSPCFPRFSKGCTWGWWNIWLPLHLHELYRVRPVSTILQWL